MKMKHSYLILNLVATIMLIIFPDSTIDAQDWVKVKTFQPAQTLHCIRFASDQVGYTVSSLYNGTTYNIHKTTDGGETWIDQSSGYSATRFKDIWAFSEDTVMMCGNYGLVIRTFDGGENWVADTVAESGDHLFGISFVGQTGYVCGNSGAIYKTTNLGDTWTQVNPPYISAIEDICFLDENYGFICGLNLIYYTTDGGETWLEPASFPGATINWWLREFSFPNDSVGYVCGDIGQIYKTTDRGKNWQYMENSPTTESIQGIAAWDENHLFACGFAGTVMRSTDGAESWQLMTAASTQNFYSIDFTPNGSGFVCSQIGEVLRYVDPSLAIIESTLNDQITVFPNPSKQVISFSFKDGVKIQEIFREISIYNVSGTCLGVYPANEMLNISELKTGAYLLVFSRKNGLINQRVLVKE